MGLCRRAHDLTGHGGGGGVVAKALMQVEGRKQLAASMKTAGVALGDLSQANRDAAGVVAPVAAQGAPHRTGRLAASLRGQGTRTRAGITSRLPYAGPIHFGWPAHNIEANPFATEAATRTEDRWTAIYQARIDQILSKIRGV